MPQNTIYLSNPIKTIALFSTAIILSATAVAAGDLVFIVDASGSMERKFENSAKIETVKNVLSKIVKELSPDRKAGLVVYGHRTRGDCEDVEELVPLVPLEKGGDIFVRKIKKIVPVGMTPICLGIQKAIEMAGKSEKEVSFVIIADGRDSCLGNPCDLAGEINTDKTETVVNVIGLDVSRGDTKQLACIARAGGGRYFPVKTEGELESAVRQSVRESAVLAGRNKKVLAPPKNESESKEPAERKLKSETVKKKPAKAYAGNSEPIKTLMLTVRANPGNVRIAPTLGAEVVFRIRKGDIVAATEKNDGWYKIHDEKKGSGWAYHSLFFEPAAKKSVISGMRVLTGGSEEKAVFETDRSIVPKVFIDKNGPKIVCDFPDTLLGDGIDLPAGGKLIHGIRTGLRNGNDLRVVLELAPGNEYELEHIFANKGTKYVLIVKKAD